MEFPLASDQPMATTKELKRISVKARRVLLFLSDEDIRGKTEAIVSYERLARSLALNLVDIREAVNQLRGLGLVEEHPTVYPKAVKLADKGRGWASDLTVLKARAPLKKLWTGLSGPLKAVVLFVAIPLGLYALQEIIKRICFD